MQLATGVSGLSRWLTRMGWSRTLTSATRASLLSGDATCVAANVYISEGRDREVITRLTDAVASGSSPGARLGHVFVDDAYNRTGFTLVSSSVEGLVDGALAVSMLALDLVDLRRHSATHPRLGVVDHVACHPLIGDAATMDAARMARDAIGKALGERGVATYLYGVGAGVDLASVRRRFGYFRANSSGSQWRGADADWAQVLRRVPPDFGPASLRGEWGIACVGCVPWVVNHNVVLDTADVDLAKRLAKEVSERGGGLAGVQAMGLAYEGGQVEVACNLLDASVSRPEDVDAFLNKALDALATAGPGRRVSIVRSYQTGKTTEELRALL